MPKKRCFIDLRDSILSSLSTGQLTVNQISEKAGINWKTVDNHLIYLVGKGFVEVVFSSPYVKIFEISEVGIEYLEKKEVKHWKY